LTWTFDIELVTIAGEEFGALYRNRWNRENGTAEEQGARDKAR
jgi:hypothetical protein